MFALGGVGVNLQRTRGKRKLLVAVEVQLSFQRESLKAVDKELPAEGGNVLLQKVQQEQLAEDDGSIPHHSVKLEIQAQAQTLKVKWCMW